MQAVTLKDAKRNLPRLVEQVLADAEPRIVVTDEGGQVVVMPLDEFNSWKETLYLLGKPANAAHLRRSHLRSQVRSGGDAGASRRMNLTFTPTA
jgi:antitoxin YefM